jgi:polar amino acid transport system substrate-binding protein
VRFVVLILLLLLAAEARAGDAVLAPGGTLRAAYIASNVAQARIDPATGAASGVSADLARALARRADVPVTITPVPTAAAVIDAVRSGAADIGFVAPNPERTGLVLYSQTYMLVQQSALVRADAPFRSVAELDRPGNVIGVNTGDSVGVWLKQRLAAARLRATLDYTLRDAVAWLRNGEIVAFAGGRQRLLSATHDDRNLRMLDDNFYSVPQAIAVPLDRADRLAWINAALNEIRANGSLAEWIEKSDVAGLTVAPPPAE